MRRILSCILLAACLSPAAYAAATISSATLSVDDSRFYFDVVIDGLPATDTNERFRIATTGNAFGGSDIERIQFNFDAGTGAITYPEIVTTFGTPADDRWLDGPITDLSLVNTNPESWRITGSVAHGTQPFVVGDTVSDLTIRTDTAGEPHLRNIVVEELAQEVTPGSVTVSAISGNTTEAGGSATFTVVLDSQPTDPVSIDLSSDNTSEGTVAPATLVFDDTNWNTPQVVTVTGQDDDIVDGNVAFSILTDATVSADAAYSGKAVDDVSVINEDDDVPPVIPVTPAAPLAPIPTLSDLALLLMAALMLLAGLRQRRIQ